MKRGPKPKRVYNWRTGKGERRTPETDPNVDAWIADRCTVSPTAQYPTTGLLLDFLRWCHEHGIHHEYGDRHLARQLTARGFPRVYRSSVRRSFRIGIAVSDET